MREFRPLGNTIFPPVVKNLLIINGIVFLATNVFQNSLGFDMYQHFALYYYESPNFRIWQFITHLFMHGDFMHIFSNMLALWMFGAVLENFFGSKKFLQYYILTGLGAALLHTGVQYIELSSFIENSRDYLANPTLGRFGQFIENTVPEAYQRDFNSLYNFWQADPTSLNAKNNSVELVKQLTDIKINIPTVGASGAVFGLLLAFGMLFPNAVIYLYFFFPLKAKYFVFFYGLFELYSGIANNPDDNVAHFAHLGGMLIGFILIKLWRVRRPGDYF
ncbi:intramembrane serine protease GlpG [Pedobacter glucosidilyticus]|uniref:Rhomboid family intramembrane serine protease n=1 Tax=Pedobacter aquae TaxID=2605747 RepID=A0A5C0VJJ9_9SPHI|nr:MULTISPECIES: rhomboid family intramembrane serine protease [Pedobacter]KHJ37526.1 intramembrane serine protease GlpG [Pedobacter glucosidilyticus]QEK52002.1 rhomboid family intramembrane serine protease [Pedobacter aquae]